MEEFLQVDSQSDGSSTGYWDMYSPPSPFGDIIDTHKVCVLLSQEATVIAVMPGFKFLPTLGPFNAPGFICTYKGTEDSLGLLVSRVTRRYNQYELLTLFTILFSEYLVYIYIWEE
jgi:hypothetical protein